MEPYVCVHAHFYQPPRENPWLEAVELQDSAYPYHDWNERITTECYAANSASRILDKRNQIVKIVNNYARISFNFGPTLLSWMEANVPEIYSQVIEADRASAQRFSGHGSALAQAYNHMILPLANRRDKQTQVLWGIRDFQRRFGRDPEGMWLPETAVDLETLEVLAEQGIRFTILAPHQARQVRKIGGGRWKNVEGEKIDPSRPYLLRLASGRTISLFFYDGSISRAVAFEGLLSNGENFAQRLLGSFSEERTWPQLMHIATDGETYGHHHRHGDMALAYALDYIESSQRARLTNYAEFLEKFPPTHEAEILEKTSWSCAHGVERWRSNCGCNVGMNSGWNQNWRTPLREALDWLRDTVAARYEQGFSELIVNPWAARDEYIQVVLDRSPGNIDAFLARHRSRELTQQERVRALKLLEMQRHAMLMYTSCGWFFDELSGIETVQVIEYAARAIQISQELFGDGIEGQFLERLSRAESNIAERGNGAQIYERSVRPAMVNLLSVGAHYAISSLFDRYAERTSIYCYDVELGDEQRMESGRARLGVGRARIYSRITLESAEVQFGVIHFGDHNLNAGVRQFRDEETYQALVRDASQSFSRADFPEVIRVLDRHFEGATYSLKSLFRDEQRKVVDQIVKSILAETEASYRLIYDHHASLLRFLSDLGTPPPRLLRMTAEIVLNGSLRRAFQQEPLDLEQIATLLEAAKQEKVPLDAAGLAYTLQKRIEDMAGRMVWEARELAALERFEGVINMVRKLPFEVNLWKAQNVYYDLLQTLYPTLRAHEDADSQQWASHFVALGKKLGISEQALPAEILQAA